MLNSGDTFDRLQETFGKNYPVKNLLTHFGVDIKLRMVFLTTSILFALVCLSVSVQITLEIGIKNLKSGAGSVIMDFRNGKDEPV